KIVGYSLHRNLSAKGCIAALRMALRNNPVRESLIHHSDRGLQYCSSAYVKLLGKKTQISMTENGDPLENAIAERVNGILKDELLQDQYNSFEEARKSVARSIAVYNALRPHSSCDMLTPQQAHTKEGVLKKQWKNYYKQKEV